MESKVNFSLDQLQNNVIGMQQQIESTAVAPFEKKTLQDQLTEMHDFYVDQLLWLGKLTGQAETLKQYVPAMGMAIPEERVKKIEESLDSELQKLEALKLELVKRLEAIMKTPAGDKIQAQAVAENEATQ